MRGEVRLWSSNRQPEFSGLFLTRVASPMPVAGEGSTHHSHSGTGRAYDCNINELSQLPGLGKECRSLVLRNFQTTVLNKWYLNDPRVFRCLENHHKQGRMVQAWN